MGNKKLDIKTVIDRNEKVSSMEPLLLASDSWFRSELNELSVDLASSLRGRKRSGGATDVSCDTILSEDFNAGQFYSGIVIMNPF